MGESMVLRKLVDEFLDLAEKTTRLKKTIDCGEYPNQKAIPTEEMDLLSKQYEGMMMYAKVLSKRINLLQLKLLKGE